VNQGIHLLPETASAHAGEMNWLFAGLLITSGMILALVFGLMVVFCIRYRRNSPIERGNRLGKTWRVEVGWTAATFVLFLGLYFWGANLYIELFRPPADTTDIHVVAKQWMWKVEHPGGQREINELHIPVDRPIRLVMTSQDVIHDFAIPAFRIRHDVLPGRYETMWFKPTRVGQYRLFCAEFCGTEHSHMTGIVTVMERGDYQRWLDTQAPGETLVVQGAALFREYGCSGCHGAASTVHAPPLEGLFGRPVPLADGSIVTADEGYIRDSILMPKTRIAAGYPAIMPSFDGQIGEEDLLKLISYVKSLGSASPGAGERAAR
jgi:cytochrome c oxidase subunit II